MESGPSAEQWGPSKQYNTDSNTTQQNGRLSRRVERMPSFALPSDH